MGISVNEADKVEIPTPQDNYMAGTRLIFSA
jgi:hypothetical protein